MKSFSLARYEETRDGFIAAAKAHAHLWNAEYPQFKEASEVYLRLFVNDEADDILENLGFDDSSAPDPPEDLIVAYAAFHVFVRDEVVDDDASMEAVAIQAVYMLRDNPLT